MASAAKYPKILKTLFRPRSVWVHEIAENVHPTINRKNEKIIKSIKEKIEVARNSEIVKKIKSTKGFYTLEMTPPTSQTEMQKLQSDLQLVKEFIKNGCWKHLTVRQAWLLILVGTEITLWFFLGETIGKMHLVGYKV
ncbi:unnamed protein product [Chilo suppressalis]|uniref:ATP synthase subunit n=1 Tax=Chilo suppressalis TaxID=168631 RepID=A0ABN8B8D1_CHISP|nr:unnamed protein product [Chilo suppressalis]